MSFTEILAVVYLVSLLVGAYAAAFPIRRHFQEEKRKNQRIEDALLGTDETKELPATPSLFFQMQQVKAELIEVKKLTAQLKPNGGKSVFDRVTQTAADVIKIGTKLDEHISETHHD